MRMTASARDLARVMCVLFSFFLGGEGVPFSGGFRRKLKGKPPCLWATLKEDKPMSFWGF